MANIVEDQKEWVNINKVKVGDYVKILRKPTRKELNNWGIHWDSTWMDQFVGQEAKIYLIEDRKIGLRSPEGMSWSSWVFPYFILQAKKKTNYEILCR